MGRRYDHALKRALLVSVALIAGCSEDKLPPATMQKPMTAPPPTGGMVATPTPAGRSGAGTTATPPPPPAAGMRAAGSPSLTTAGSGVAGAGGSTGTSSTSAGAGGMVIPMAGASGSVAVAGMGAAGSATEGTGGKAPTGDGKSFIRGPDPTDASVMGNAKGPYKVERYTSGYRNGPDYADSTIHWPSDADPPFAAVAVVPGFVSPQSSIQSWGPFLASHGIVTMTIGTNSGSDPPETRKRALLDALKTIESENTRMGGPLNGKISTDHFATMGWSMGGGGTLLVANENPNMKATIGLCSWNPGYAYSKNKVPTLMFASLGDPLAGGQSQGFYLSIPASTSKMLIEFPGADHYIGNNPAYVNGEVGRYGLAWLKVFLEGDERYRKFLLQKPKATTTDFQSNVK